MTIESTIDAAISFIVGGLLALAVVFVINFIFGL